MHFQNTGGQDDFQTDQTAKARPGPPCAVTPETDMAASASQGSVENVVLCPTNLHPAFAANATGLGLIRCRNFSPESQPIT